MKYFLSIIFVLVSIVGVVVGTGYDSEDDNNDEYWTSWKNSHGRAYASDEEEVERKATWKENMAMIAKHNVDYQSGVYSYRLAMNQFGDLKTNEFLRLYTGLKTNITRKTTPYEPSADEDALPTSVNWQKEGYVTPVKDQGQCGSCWAFSTTGALEGQHFKKTGKLVSLSEQNLVDCSKRNRGCNGGWVGKAFKYVKNAGGIDTETSYPYMGRKGTCKFSKSSVGATCTGYKNVFFHSERALKKAVAQVGPISVAVDASSFQFYSRGIYDNPKCSSWSLDHAVLVVGYGSSDGHDYWIVKNSWGRSWGMKGYIMMSRNKDNQCGIASAATYPLI